MNTEWTPEILLSHQAFLRALALRLVDAADADDAVQDTYVAALESSAQPRRPRAWLGTVLRNAAVSRRRARERRRLREKVAARSEPVPPADEAVAQLEAQRRAVAAVLALEPAYRDVILARFLQGLSVARTARKLDLPRETVRTRQRRALAMLRVRLDDEHDGNRIAWAAPLAATASGGIGAAALLVGAAVLAAFVVAGIAVLGADRSEDPRAVAAAGADRGAAPNPGSAPASGAAGPGPIDRDLDLFGVVVGAAPQRVRITTRIRPFFDDLRGARDGPATLTEADGTFRIRLRRGERVRLRAEAEGFADVAMRATAGQRVRIELERGVAATLRVVDREGRPVEGAQVSAKTGLLGHTGSGGEWNGRLAAAAEVSAFARGLFADGRLDESGVAVLKLEGGPVVSGRVVAAGTGEPIAGARLSWGPAGPYPILTTASDGTFSFASSGPLRSFLVRAAGFVPATVALDKAAVVELKRGHEVRGVVVDGSDAPIEAAGVRFDLFRAETDAAGRFVFADLPEQRPLVLVHADGYAPVRTRETRIVLKPGLAVEGRLLDAAGQPRTGERVQLRANGLSENVTTDDLGRFRFRDVPAGPVSLHAAPLSARAKAGDLDVVLQPAARNEIAVLVRAADGTPVAGARVSIRRRRATTDADGRATLALRADEHEVDVRVRSERPGHLDGDVRGHDVASGPCVVRLRRAEIVGGRIVNDKDEPYPHVVLAVRGSEFRGSCWSDESGAFSVAVPAGATVNLWPTGQVRDGNEALSGALLGVRAGAKDLVLKLSPAATRTVRVRVEDPDGNPLAGARVHVRGPPVATNADGWAEFPKVPRMFGGAHVGWHKERNGRWIAPENAELRPDTDELVLRYQAAALIRGRVVDAKTEPVAGAQVRTANRLRGVFTEPDGSFTLPVPKDDPGPFRIEVRAMHLPGYKNCGIARLDGVAPGAEDVLMRVVPR